MGLFGSRKKTYVGTSIVRAIEDDKLPDSMKTGLLQAMQADGNITDYVQEELLSSIGRRAEKAYRYAKNSYPFGLPFAQTLGIGMGIEEVTTILSAAEGQPVSIEYSNMAAGNSIHFAWMKLIADWGYNPDTNELAVLSATKGHPVFLKDFVPVYQADVLGQLEMPVIQQWGASPGSGPTPTRPSFAANFVPFSPPEFDASGPLYERIHFWFEWDVTTEETLNGVTTTKHDYREDSLYTEAITLNDDADYLHVKYTVDGVTKYWAYQMGSGGYLVLDQLIDRPNSSLGEFFPYLYFRHQKTPISADTASEEYLACKKISKILGMDYDQIDEAIQSNPDIDDVEQAVMMFCVPVTTTDPLEQKYLFEFLKKMYVAQDNKFSFEATALMNIVNRRQNSIRSGIVIKDELFEFALRHDGITKTVRRGTIGPKGTYTREMVTVTETYTITTESGEEPYSITVPIQVFKYQIGTSIYEEIRVRDLKTVFKVFEQYETTGDEEDDILIIPLDRSITEKYTIRDRERLYARAMHYVFNSRVVVKVKWYQTGIFKAFLIVVSIFLAFYDMGSTFAALAAGGTAAAAAALLIIKRILYGVIIQAVVKIFVKAIGLEAAFLIAIMAALAGAYQWITNGGVAGAPWVKELVQLSTSLTSGIEGAAKDILGDLLADYEDWTLNAKEQQEALANAQSLLDQKSWLSPFVIFGESPSDYFDRTVHSGNIGVLTIEAVTDYVQVALTLPKLADSVGDMSYGT